MRIGFYYHTPVSSSDGGLWLPGFIGIFIDELARNCERLVLVLHEARIEESKVNEYCLRSTNVDWISLGPKRPAWHRTIFHRQTIAGLAGRLDVDHFILRSPSPLAPYFTKLPCLRERICYMVISDYGVGADHVECKSIRNIAIYFYLKLLHRQFHRVLRNRKVVVNSRALFRSLESVTKDLHEIRTTTLRETDLLWKTDTCGREVFKILYTGRFVVEKGLVELVEAGLMLAAENVNLEIHLVGWEENGSNAVKDRLAGMVKGGRMDGKLIIHGKKEVGEELNTIYRDADIYVIASYFEGFPRTIWEAMANSVPVVASRVGSIPDYLRDGEDALLVEPKNVGQLADAIRSILTNGGLRRKLIRNGFEKAKGVLLPSNVKELVSLLESGR